MCPALQPLGGPQTPARECSVKRLRSSSPAGGVISWMDMNDCMQVHRRRPPTYSGIYIQHPAEGPKPLPWGGAPAAGPNGSAIASTASGTRVVRRSQISCDLLTTCPRLVRLRHHGGLRNLKSEIVLHRAKYSRTAQHSQLPSAAPHGVPCQEDHTWLWGCNEAKLTSTTIFRASIEASLSMLCLMIKFVPKKAYRPRYTRERQLPFLDMDMDMVVLLIASLR